MLIASKDDWDIFPLPQAREMLLLNSIYTADEMKVIRRGLIPDDMGDKWFIYAEGNQLYMHRALSGFCTYIAFFEESNDGNFRLTHALVNRDEDEYTPIDPAIDLESIPFLIGELLLRKSMPVPLAVPDDETERALWLWAEIGRASIGEHPEM